MENNTKQTILANQVFLVMTGFLCNNNCIMCSVRPKSLNYKPRSTEEIIKDIKLGRKQGYQRIEFTGGEPTIRKDIILLIQEAKKMRYSEIAISTNARMFSSLKYLRLLIKSGLNRVTTTLYAPNPTDHELITRAPGSFIQTVSGIKNVVGQNITISVNTVIFSATVKKLRETGEFIAKMGVKYWTLLDLIPDGYALEQYNKFSVSPQQLKNAFRQIEPILNNFQAVNFLDFPFCLIPKNIFSHQNCNILAAKGRTEIINQVGYKPKRFEQKNSTYYDIHKKRSKKCYKCLYNNECGGIWVPYLKLYGETFINPF